MKTGRLWVGARHTAWFSEHSVDVCEITWNLILRIDYMEKPWKTEQTLSKALPCPCCWPQQWMPSEFLVPFKEVLEASQGLSKLPSWETDKCPRVWPLLSFEMVVQGLSLRGGEGIKQEIQKLIELSEKKKRGIHEGMVSGAWLYLAFSCAEVSIFRKNLSPGTIN